MKLIDLHTHSTASDGTDSPAELVKKAADMGLAALALTDHDTLKGLEEAEEAASGTGLEFIRGCELSTSTDQGSIHIVGLWLPRKCNALEEYLQQRRERRDARNREMIGLLRKAGANISMEEVEAIANGTPGRPHIATLLVDKGYARDKTEAFRDWIGETGKAYVPKDSPAPEEAVRLLRSVGASPVIAHPRLRKPPAEWLDGLVGRLRPAGLCALEAWHSAHTPEDEAEVRRLAEKYDLGLSGGSDYHGIPKPDISLGTGKGSLSIGMDVLERLKARRKAAGLTG